MTELSYIVILSVFYAVLCLIFYQYVFKEPVTDRSVQKQSYSVSAGLGLLALLFLQSVASGLFPGHVQDTSLFRAWTAFANDHPVWEYYTTELYVDYPPVYLYVLYAIGKLTKWVGISPTSGVYLACIRSIPIIFDGLSALFVYVLALPRLGQKKAIAAGALCALCPIGIFNSTVWGQVDSVTTLLSAIMLLLLYRKRYIGSAALLAVLFLTKPQMIMFSPLIGFVIFFDILSVWKDKPRRNRRIVQAFGALGVVILLLLLVPLPITGGNYSLLLENYRKALGLYPYATLNAPNLYGLFGGNWAPDSQPFLLFSYKAWGFLSITVLSLLVGFGAWKQKSRAGIFLLGAFTVFGVYLFGHGMHERYAIPGLLLLLVYYILSEDHRQVLFYGGFSLTTFLVSGQVLLLNHQNDFIYSDNLFFRLLSLVNVILFLLWLACSCGLFGQPKLKVKEERQKAAFSLTPSEKPVRLVRLDYLLMLLLTAFYAVFGFYHLGSAKVPESGWYVESADESVVFDFGETVPVRQLYLYTGWIDRRISDREVKRSVTISFSSDGETWDAGEELFELDTVFMWNVYRAFPKDCRFVRLTCDDGRFYLNEAAFFGENESERFVPSVLHGNRTAERLLDEPDRVRYEFSFYDTTYFDEIYHPRTAYEFITHRYPYENTHPPLGKNIIACGMLLFGVNPFGWRFFGTLCGVLMVPLLYVMGKKMLKDTALAFFVTFVFTFDFMHLSQTRLATIDSFTVFFVMGMYLFMYLYIEKSFYDSGVKKTLPPLLASGICFGLGAATKWQGVYAGLGLCFLFFFSLARRYMEYRQAKKEPAAPGAERALQCFKPMALKTILAGFGFFVLIPAVIYFLSYIPAMMSETTGLSFFFTNQESMLRYHATLTAPHSYGSAWWQWPFDYKPLYAYSPNRDFVPEGTAMGITSFGNPAVWWLTIPAVLWGVSVLLKRKEKTDLGILTAVVGFFSLYAPWIFVTRTAFIYHFFPCVVFVVLLIGYGARRLLETDSRFRTWLWAYMILVFVLFLAFYPVLTGLPIPQVYAYCLRWFPGWVLG